MNKLLQNVTILDIGRYVAGPFCSTLLADLGANVIRIDKVGGNEDRMVLTEDIQKDGALYLAVNRNKKSICLDISCVEGSNVLKRIISTCDVVIANMPDEYLEKLGLDYKTLCETKHDIILASINGFGFQFQGVAFDSAAQMVSGAVSVTGFPDMQVKSGVSFIDYGTALSCAYGVLAAILHKLQTGNGQHLHCSLVGTGLMMMGSKFIQGKTCKLPKIANGNKGLYGGPTDLFHTQNGKVYIAVLGNVQFKKWAKLLNCEHYLSNPLFETDVLRGLNCDSLCNLTAAWCLKRTTDECLDQLKAAGIPAAPFLNVEEASKFHQFHKAGFFNFIEYPHYDDQIQIVANPVNFVTMGKLYYSRPPLSGEHTIAILKNIGYDCDDIEYLLEKNVTYSYCDVKH